MLFRVELVRLFFTYDGPIRRYIHFSNKLHQGRAATLVRKILHHVFVRVFLSTRSSSLSV